MKKAGQKLQNYDEWPDTWRDTSEDYVPLREELSDVAPLLPADVQLKIRKQDEADKKKHPIDVEPLLPPGVGDEKVADSSTVKS